MSFVLFTGLAAVVLAPQSAVRVEHLRANETVPGKQDQVALSSRPDGSGAVAWRGRRQAAGRDVVLARSFDERGEWRGPEARVSSVAVGNESGPALACGPGGALWCAWESHGFDGDGASIALRRIDERGATEATLAAEELRGAQTEPSIAAAPGGGACVVWNSNGETRSRRFAADGMPRGPERRVSATLAGERELHPAVEALGDGSFFVVWSHFDAAGRPAGVVAQRLDESGARSGEAMELEGDSRGAIEPVLASDGRGNAWFTWLEPAGELWSIAGRSWSSELGLGERWTPSELAAARRSGLAVALRRDGALGLAWTELGEGWREPEVRVARVDAAGAVLSIDRATAECAGEQVLEVGRGSRKLAWLGDDTLAIAWSGAAGDDDSVGARVSRIRPGEALAQDIEGACDTPEPVALAAEPHEPPTYDPTTPLTSIQSVSVPPGIGPDFAFAGIADTGWNPPDPHLAAGPQHLVLICNGRIAFFAKDGTLVYDVTLDGPLGFWGSVGAQTYVFDPEIAFDPPSGRFFAAAVERHVGAPYFLLAVSDDSDPNGAWQRFRIPVGTLANDNDIDSTNLSVGDSWVALSADFFAPDKHFVHALDKAALLAGSLVGTSTSIPGPPLGTPAVAQGATAAFYLEAPLAPLASTIDVVAVVDPLGLHAVQRFTLPVPPFTAPENPPQLGASQHPQTFDARFWSVAYSNGSLWATHHVDLLRVRQRWYEIALNGWPAVGALPSIAQWGEIDLGGDVRTCYGSVAVDGQGRVAFVFTRTGPSEPLSIARAWRSPSDPPGQLRPAQTLQISGTPDTTGRWGDYSAVAPDPTTPGAFWAHHEARFVAWTTWVVLFGEPAAPANYCTSKISSQGLAPTVNALGPPSLGADDFWIELRDAVPGALSVFVTSPQPTAHPFRGGTMCLAAPRDRLETVQVDPTGRAQVRVPLSIASLGVPAYFQAWFRDGAHPDGTGAGLSNGLRVVPGP